MAPNPIEIARKKISEKLEKEVRLFCLEVGADLTSKPLYAGSKCLHEFPRLQRAEIFWEKYKTILNDEYAGAERRSFWERAHEITADTLLECGLSLDDEAVWAETIRGGMRHFRNHLDLLFYKD